MGKKYCLVIVDMFSKWVEAFPTSKADSKAVAKALVTEIIPRWGIPKKISSDNGSHFANDVITHIGEYFGIDMRKHCAYHPQSGGAVERENGTLKNKLAKCCEETGLAWTKALPVVLLQMRARVRQKNQLSPYEVLFGRPPNTGIGPERGPLLTTVACENDMLEYCSSLLKSLSQIHGQVKEALPKQAEGLLHDLKPGDWVVVREAKRKTWKSPRWVGPFQILLITHTAVKVQGRATWVHAHHCKRATAPPGDDSSPDQEEK